MFPERRQPILCYPFLSDDFCVLFLCDMEDFTVRTPVDLDIVRILE
jgi:hypothetical protein